MKKYENIKEVEDVEVQFASNGFIVKFNGRNDKDDWENFSHITHNFDEVVEIIKLFAEKQSLT